MQHQDSVIINKDTFSDIVENKRKISHPMFHVKMRSLFKVPD